MPFVNFSTNGLIFQLSEEDRSRLQQICHPVALQAGQDLSHPASEADGCVYFLQNASVILWVQPEDGSRLAVGLIGSEGAVGLGSALGESAPQLRFEVQHAGSAWCADGQALAQLLRQHPRMLWVVARYLWQLTHDIARMAASVQYDDIPTRLAAWLVLCVQRTGSRQLQLTHEQLARMLGVRRVSVTQAAVALKGKGLLDYKRGSLDILDLAGLEQQAQSVSQGV